MQFRLIKSLLTFNHWVKIYKRLHYFSIWVGGVGYAGVGYYYGLLTMADDKLPQIMFWKALQIDRHQIYPV